MGSQFQVSARVSAAALLVFRAGAIAGILFATLRPAGSEAVPPGWIDCIICGPRGLAEAIQNVFLFMPFGMAFMFGGGRLRRVVVMGALLSLAVELIQQALPGRDAALGDILFNTLGAWAGGGLALIVPYALDPQPSAMPWLALAWAMLVALVIAGTGLLLRPLERDPGFVMWAPDLPQLPRFPGKVLSARIGDIPLAEGHIPDPDAVARAWRSGEPLTATALRTREHWKNDFAPVIVLKNTGGAYQIMLGTTAHDLAFIPRSAAAALTLDQPILRLRGAADAQSHNDTLRLAAEQQPTGYCLSTSDTRACALRYSAAHGWALVRYPRALPGWLESLLGVAWLGGLAFPLGVWAGRHPLAYAALALLVTSLLVLPPLLGLETLRAYQWAAVGAGVVLGRIAGRLASNKRFPFPASRSRRPAAGDA